MNLLEAHQLVKLPAFIHHFQEHKLSNQSLTIWEFLDLHYANPSNDTPDADHGKLPFKSHQCQHVNIAMELPSNVDSKSEPICSEIELALQVDHYCFNDGKAIWQPPQLLA
jgi:hypothetical protein